MFCSQTLHLMFVWWLLNVASVDDGAFRLTQRIWIIRVKLFFFIIWKE